MAMTDHQLPISTGFVEVDGGQLHYEVAGKGQPLILLQENGLVDKRIWDYQFLTFAHHYRVIRYDKRGYGQSLSSKKPYTAVDDLAQILQTLNIESAYLLALGAGLALDFVHAHAYSVDAIILVSPEINLHQSFDEAMADLPAILERLAPAIEAVKQNDMQRATDLVIQDLMLPSSANYQWVRNIVAKNFQAVLNPPLPPSVGINAFSSRHQWYKEIHVPTLLLIGDSARSEI
ncbi:hypothetical protein KSC_055320 [Ktedonobacter sp. SOSP1-52]|nr:hypothetical protein KSC_055320 [Ktedonobacter sp. SOSP1-52]